jgi:chromosome segregation ATPase
MSDPVVSLDWPEEEDSLAVTIADLEHDLRSGGFDTAVVLARLGQIRDRAVMEEQAAARQLAEIQAHEGELGDMRSQLTAAETDRDEWQAGCELLRRDNVATIQANAALETRVEKAKAEVARVRAAVAEEIAAAIEERAEDYDVDDWEEAINALKDAATIAREHATEAPDVSS